MKKKEIVIVVLLVAFGFIYNAVEKGKFRFNDDLSFFADERSLVSVQYAEFPQREVVFPAPEKIVIDNPAGEIVIERSVDGQVHLWPVVRVYYAKKTDMEDVRRQVQVRTRMENNQLRVSVDPVSAFPYKHVRVHFKLLVPEGAALDISNQEGNVSIRRGGAGVLLKQERGNVFLEDISAAVQIDLRAGNLQAKNIAGKVSMEIRHGDVILDDVAALQLKGKHGSFSLKNIQQDVLIDHAFGDVTLDGAGKAEIFGRQSKIDVRHVGNGVTIKTSFQSIVVESCSGDIRLSGRSGHMDIRNVNAKSVVVENSFADIAITDCAGEDLNVLLKNGSFNFQDSRFSNRMSIESRQAGIHLALGILPDPTFNIRTVQGRIFNHSAIEMDIFAQKDENFANRVGQKPEIIVNNHYGDVHIK